MTPESANIAAKCIALPGWRWLPGMLGCRAPAGGADDLRPEIRVVDAASAATAEQWGCVPALDDPATAGAMLDLIAQADRKIGATTKMIQVAYQSARRTSACWVSLSGYDGWPAASPHRQKAKETGSGLGPQGSSGRSLGEAIARLAVERGTWL